MSASCPHGGCQTCRDIRKALTNSNTHAMIEHIKDNQMNIIQLDNLLHPTYWNTGWQNPLTGKTKTDTISLM